MIIPLEHYLVFAAVLFCTGIYGVLAWRNIIGILLSIELILNAANINFIVFSRTTSLSPETGQLFVVFTMALAAAAIAVGLAIVLALFRSRKTIFTDEIRWLKW
ncbi:MAG: NADH-quinone oxidoreductase subunit NuoK [Candidatus Omnitrophota bacterium]